jgi:Tat protein translocase TatB subunit
MFGFGSIGGWELIFLVVLALMLFGPRRIPEIARTLGKTIGQLRRASHDFRTGIEREVEAERLKDAGDALRSLRDEVGSIRREALDGVRQRTAPPAHRPSTPDRADRTDEVAAGDRPDGAEVPSAADGTTVPGVPPSGPSGTPATGPDKERSRRDERTGDE